MQKKSSIILLIAIILSIILGAFSLYTPKPQGSESSGFSSELAKEHIKEIAKQPHSIYQQDALAEVREYIVDEFEELGLEAQVFNYKNVADKNGNLIDMNNIYTKIDGKDGENGSYILLATHYDSSPKKRAGEDGDSRGAADAGYGISTILEILRNIKDSGQPLENGIKVLITDGEEMGLLGAKQEMNENFSLYENVSFVVNLEARGIKGPALMFETSINNKKVIDLYKNANLPVSYSLAADVYRKMPNGSDFTEFLKKDLQGINFAVLNNLDYYHTKEDNYDNVSDTSVQHYGEQVLPIVEEFVYSSEYNDVNYFESYNDAVFFSFLPNVFITYSDTISIILTVIAIVLLLVATRFSKQRVGKVLKYLGTWFAIAIGSVVCGLASSYVISMITGMKFSLTYMPKVPAADWITLVAIVILTISVGVCIIRRVKSIEDKEAMIFGATWFNGILLIIFMIVLPGGSYLFVWPVLLILASMVLSQVIRKNGSKFVFLLPLIFTIIMYVPVLFNIYIALTIGALGVVLLLAVMALSIIIPIVNYLLD